MAPLAPIVENPYGVHDHDVLSGRGAFVNGHVGNARFRQHAIDRKPQFDAGNYSEKRSLATEIVGIIRSLDPPGRFLKRMAAGRPKPEDGGANVIEGGWEELNDDRAIHKACQVMRDLQRPDRLGDRKSNRKGGKVNEEEEEVEEKLEEAGVTNTMEGGVVTGVPVHGGVDEVVLTTEEVLDKALVDTVTPGEVQGGDAKANEAEEQKVAADMMHIHSV